jgi:chorismate mutase/prephenate dehydratase
MSLDQVRRDIDKVDARLVALLNERAHLVLKVRDLKQSTSAPAYTPHRERQVYTRVAELNQGPFPPSALKAVYREIMSAALAMEGKPRIAYMGPAFTFTHLAAMERFGSQCEYVAVEGVPGTFDEVEQRRADYGVVPVENSTEGVIRHTLDHFIGSELKICSEFSMAVRQNLLTKTGKLDKGTIRLVVSHPQPLAQARHWLATHLPGVPTREMASTTLAAQVAAKDRSVAALGNTMTARAYGLKVAASNIQDQSDNTTRFLVIGRTVAQPTGHDKTSVMVSLRDRVGALAAMLKPFEDGKINLTSIESRPSHHRKWEYYFFIDFLGHQQEPKIQRVLEALRRTVHEVKVLGSYPTE